jgi:hypothetical protein
MDTLYWMKKIQLMETSFLIVQSLCGIHGQNLSNKVENNSGQFWAGLNH